MAVQRPTVIAQLVCRFSFIPALFLSVCQCRAGGLMIETQNRAEIHPLVVYVSAGPCAHLLEEPVQRLSGQSRRPANGNRPGCRCSMRRRSMRRGPGWRGQRRLRDATNRSRKRGRGAVAGFCANLTGADLSEVISEALRLQLFRPSPLCSCGGGFPAVRLGSEFRIWLASRKDDRRQNWT
jgi:hypothetical protein